MGPHLPSPSRKSPYVTRQGFEALQTESRALWKRRGGVTSALAAAAAEGDRSENAEYIFRKKELREIDRRIRFLVKRLPELKIVEVAPTDRKRVFFGAWVTLENSSRTKVRYRIVGPDEIDPKRNLISVDSPLARALLKRRVNDEVSVRTPTGAARYRVLEIRYEAGD